MIDFGVFLFREFAVIVGCLHDLEVCAEGDKREMLILMRSFFQEGIELVLA